MLNNKNAAWKYTFENNGILVKKEKKKKDALTLQFDYLNRKEIMQIEDVGASLGK